MFQHFGNYVKLTLKISDIKESFLNLSNKIKSRHNFVLFVVSLLYLCSWIILVAVLCHSAQKSHLRFIVFLSRSKNVVLVSLIQHGYPFCRDTCLPVFFFAFYVILLILVACKLPPWESLIQQILYLLFCDLAVKNRVLKCCN